MESNIFTFRISYAARVYRVIEIKGNASLSDLADFILHSFDFINDHCFGFYDSLNPRKCNESYELFVDMDDCDPSDGARSVEKTHLSDVFYEKKKMIFLFDYGDDWNFTVECKKISTPTSLPKEDYPRIIKSVGEAPKQYEYDEEDEDDEEDDAI